MMGGKYAGRAVYSSVGHQSMPCLAKLRLSSSPDRLDHLHIGNCDTSVF